MKILVVTNHNAPVVRLQIDGMKALGVEMQLLLSERAAIGRNVYLHLHRRLTAVVNDYDPDVVHVQFGGVQAAVASIVVPNRCVVTFHGTDLHGGTRTPNVLSAISQRVGVWCSRFAARRVASNILVSENLRSRLPRGATHVDIIPTGVDFEKFRPIDRSSCLTELGLDDSIRWVLFCDCNNDPVKRRELAEAAVSTLNTLGCRASLLLLHNITHDRVPLYLNAASVVIVTSDKEGSPNIVKEALACNTPVVSVDVGDVAARIGGLDGCLVSAREPVALANALNNVMSRSARPSFREFVRPAIDNTIISRRLLSVYERVCGRPHSLPHRKQRC